jgi:metal transporter CNNM
MAHLKHLGPSNLASKPKQTRYNTVKIKPGSKDDTAKHHLDLTEETDRKRPNPPLAPAQGGVGVGFGRNAASGGVHDVQAGYGGVDQHRPEMVSDFMRINSKAIPSPHYGTYGSHVAKDGSQSTLGSLRSRQSSRSPNRHKGVARSGSISENVIDVGGVRKVVLETTSSSEDTEEAGAAGQGKSASDSSLLWHTRKSYNPDDSNGQSSTRSGDGVSGSGGKKKRRRKRKKAGGNETAPLLEGKR